MQSVHQSTLELKPTTYKTFCKKLNYLVDKQQELCGLNHNILQTISRGGKLATSPSLLSVGHWPARR